MSSYAKLEHEDEDENLLYRILSVLCCRNGCRYCSDCCKQRADDNPMPSSSEQYIVQPSQDQEDDRRCSVDSRRSSAGADSRRGSSSVMSDSRRPSTPAPVIDMKPIEFWTASTNKETVQPRTPTRRYHGEFSQYGDINKFQPKLYEVEENQVELTDEEKVARYRLGQIHFSLQYNISNTQLTVRIIKAKDLPPPVCNDFTKQDFAHSNPYVKVCLLPDQKSSQQTTVKRKTQDPIFEESFTFELPFKEAQRRTLLLSVQDFDKYSRHCVIGQLILPLEGINLLKGKHMWKPLQPSTQNNPALGEILVSLNYLPSAGRLNVDIIKAKQLLQTDIITGSDPFVKIQLLQGLKLIKTKKSSTKKNTIDPVFNESFNFNVSPVMLAENSVVISVWDHNSKCRDDFVGQIVIGKYSSGPSEMTHWNRMLQSQRSPVAQWHSLHTREECEQISPASAAVS
ncbi:synaptotagmin-17-like [Ptychodera flava]|uniref:synaptotagmin-17-like n=1 Tax=Ptychodera flava TaxID=63121 RepID=UPI00396A79D1